MVVETNAFSKEVLIQRIFNFERSCLLSICHVCSPYDICSPFESFWGELFLHTVNIKMLTSILKDNYLLKW